MQYQSKARGRAVYIEPNNLPSYNYSYRKGVEPDNITWEPEELEYSIDIQVVIPDRNNSGQRDYMCDGNRILLNENKDNTPVNRYLSFMGGKDININDKKYSQLTVDYIDASYTEVIKGNVSSRECLQINSINISFDNNFYPQVSMKFTDIRGYALMMPAEYEYTESMKDDGSNNKAFRNFYRALFNEPYPLFYLTVKGYFGTPITLVLAVSNTQTSLDPTTGNFNVDVKFVGYNQGLYGDLPMEYLIVASQIEYGENGNYWKNSNFTFNDGSTMQSYLDFWENYTNYKTNGGEKQLDDDVEQANQEISQVKNAIDDLIAKYEAILDEIEKNISGGYKSFKTDKGIVLFSNSEFFCSTDSYNTIATGISSINNMDKFKDGTNTISDIFLGETGTTNNGVILKNRKNVDVFSKNQVNSVISTEIDKIETADSNISKTIVENKKDYEKAKYTLIIVYADWFDNVKKLSSTFSESQGGNSQEDEKIAEAFKEITSFVPSVENIYRMLFAHLDCFMSVFYSVLNNIKSNPKKRTFNHFKIYRQQETDVMGNETFTASGDTIVPPFPAIYKYDENGIKYLIYPGEEAKFADMEELKLVEAIITATKSVKDIGNVDNLIDEAYNAVFVPIMPTDIFYTDQNPYDGIRVSNGNDNPLVRPFYMFAIRIIAAKAFNNNTDFLNKCAKIEAETFYKVYKGQKDKIVPVLAEGSNMQALYQKVLGELLYPDGKENPLVLAKLNLNNEVSYNEEKSGVYAYLKSKYLSANRSNNSLKVYPETDNGFEYSWGDTENRFDLSIKVDNLEMYFREFNMPKMIDNFEKSASQDFSKQENWASNLNLYSTMDNNYYACNTMHDGRLMSKDESFSLTHCTNFDSYAQLCVDTINNKNYDNVKFPALCAIYLDNNKITWRNPFDFKYSIYQVNKSNAYEETGKSLFGETWFSNSADDNRMKCLYFLMTLPFSTQALCNTISRLSTYGIKKVRRCILLYIGGLIYRYHWNLNHPSLEGKGFNNDKKYINEFMLPLTMVGTDQNDTDSGFMMLYPNRGADGFYVYYNKGVGYFRCCRLYNTEECISIRDKNGIAQLISNVDRSINAQRKYTNESLGSQQENLDKIANSKIGVAIMNLFKKWADSNGSKLINALKFDSNNTDNLGGDFEINLDEGSSIGVIYKSGSNAEKMLMDFYLQDTYIFNLEANSNNSRSIDYGTLELFAKELQTLYTTDDSNADNNDENKTDTNTEKTDEEKPKEQNDISQNSDVDTQHKLVVYTTLKTLYDKWLGSYSVNRFKLASTNEVKQHKALRFDIDKANRIERTLFFEPKEFESMAFVDSYFNDISDTYMMDFTKLWYEIDLIKKGKCNKSVYETMCEIANENNLVLYGLPIYSNFYTTDNIARIFQPHTRIPVNEKNIGHTFIVMYNYQPAKQLSDKSSKGGYTQETFFIDDGFDLSRVMDNDLPIEVFPKADQDKTKEARPLIDYCVPCFGVTFGKQSQTYFTDISINMGDFNNTNYGIATQLALASTADKTGSIAISEGQDIYSLYSNRVYNVSINMLGCMNIVPLMYFQLNNVAFFKGAYMITNVSHSISPGKVTTSFNGTKISLPTIPIDDNAFKILSSSNLFVAASQGQASINNGNNDDGNYDSSLYSDYQGDGNRKLYTKYGENCRDLGGVGPIKYGILFRGGVYADDGNYKSITEIVDAEIAVGSGHVLKDLSLYNYNNWDNCYKVLDTNTECQSKVKDSLIHLMQWIIDGHKIFIHCARGCDRTGHICCIIEGLCGCSLEQMLSDYTLSNDAEKRYATHRASKYDHGYKVGDGGCITDYVKKYGKNAQGAELQKNFINFFVNVVGIDRNLINKFIKAATING